MCVSVCVFLGPSVVHALGRAEGLAGENEEKTATGKRADLSEARTAASCESGRVKRCIKMFTL